MPLVSTWGDLVVGVDLHTVLVPTPGGPVPTPLLHPHVGRTGDPAGAIVSAMTTPLMSLATDGKLSAPNGVVLVNGLPVMTTAELSRNAPMLRHQAMPPGTAFATPPSGEGIHDLGSLTVTAGGAAVVRSGDPVRTCADPVPLPTSVVIPIPKGRPVMVGGPPGMNVAQATQAFAAGVAVRTAWRAGGALARFVARHNATRLRNILDRVKCVFTGHPVDVGSGRVMTWQEDFSLPGPLPLVFERSYSSGWSDRRGALGFGWSHSLDRGVSVEPVGIVCRVADGREIVFDIDDYEGQLPPIKREIRDPITGYTIMRTAASSWRLIDPDGIIDQFEPLSSGEPIARVVRTTTRSGKISTRYHYDEAGRLVSVKDCGDRVVKLEYDGKGNLARVLLPDPAQPEAWILHAAYSYEDDLLVEARDALGHAMRYTYAGRLLVQETDRNGLSFYWGYDGRSSHARCVRTAGDGGIFNQKLDYDRKGGVTVVTDSYGNRRLYKVNEIGLVTRIVAPDGAITETKYNDIGKSIEETDALGNITRWSYDRFGHVSVTTYADGAKTVCKRDPRFPELVTVLQNEAGALWRYQYDAAAQLVESRAPDRGEVTSYEWRDGLPHAVVQPGGRRTEYTYDRQANVAAVRLPNGAETRYEYDRRGRRVRAINPYGGREDVQYDLVGHIVRVSTADQNTQETSYDAQGNVLEVRDRLRCVRFAYTGFNWVAAREDGDGQRGDTVHFAYELEGELSEIRNEMNQPYRFFYDRCRRLEREVGFDMRATEYKRDRLGRVVKRIRPSGHTDLSYDLRGRMMEQKHSDGTWARLGYRADGLLLRADNQSATVVFERDRVGRIVREIQGDDWVASTYDIIGERVLLETSRSGRMASARDASRNATKFFLGAVDQKQMEITIGYDACGLEIERALSGTVTASWQRDSLGRPRVHEVRCSDPWAQTYAWTFDDRLTSIADSRSGTITYHHDHRGRLYSAEFPDGTTQYRAPDDLGHLYRTPDRSDRRFLRGGMPRRVDDTVYELDANGNLACKGEAPDRLWLYTWDAAGMLTDVVRPDGTTVKYAYDALGRRVNKKIGDIDTRWIWDGDVPIHELRTGAPVLAWYYQDRSFALLGYVDGNEYRAVVSDHLDVPMAAYDDAGATAWTMALDTYGVSRSGTIEKSGVDAVPHRWPGQYVDIDVELYYNRFRYYDPSLGQFISPDPIGINGELELYVYTRDPLVWIDPFGLSGCKSGSEVTNDAIRATMADASLTTHQPAVSVPVVKRYVDKLAAGGAPPPIKVDRGVIVEGNHRYVAGRLFGTEPAQVAGTLASNKHNQPTIAWSEIILDPMDWGNR